MPLVTIDPASDTPVYEQIVAGVVERIASGALAVGDRLPTVRQLAEDLGVATNTVAKAYRELEARAAVETRGRNGSYIRALADDRDRLAADAARRFIETVVTDLGFSADEALALATRVARG